MRASTPSASSASGVFRRHEHAFFCKDCGRSFRRVCWDERRPYCKNKLKEYCDNCKDYTMWRSAHAWALAWALAPPPVNRYFGFWCMLVYCQKCNAIQGSTKYGDNYVPPYSGVPCSVCAQPYTRIAWMLPAPIGRFNDDGTFWFSPNFDGAVPPALE